MSERHVRIGALTEAIETRIKKLCPKVRGTGRSQATKKTDLVDLAISCNDVPAAIVVFGPADYDDALRSPATRHRIINLGVLAVGAYSADLDAGAFELWDVLDELDDAFMPSATREEDTGYPVAVLGDQSGSNRGNWIIPSGWTPLDVGGDRSAGIFNLLVVDDVRERTP